MTENVSQEIATTGGASHRAQIASMGSGDLGVFSTYSGEDRDSKIAVLQAMTDAQPISDHLGAVINLVHVVAQAVEVADDQGVVNETVRVILVDEDGTAYSALSDGLFRSVQNIFGILGMPSTWDEPLAVTVVEAKSRKGFRFFTLKVA